MKEKNLNTSAHTKKPVSQVQLSLLQHSFWQEKAAHTLPCFFLFLIIYLKSRFLLLFFFLPMETTTGGYDLQDENTHLPWHKHQNTQLSRTHRSPRFDLCWKQTHLLYTHANIPLQDVLQPCIRRKLYLNPQVCVKEQNSTRTDWIKINSFKNTLTV